MFRDARDAALQQAEDLRRELDAVRAENTAMREHILANERPGTVRQLGDVYRQPTERFAEGERVAFGHHSVDGFPVWLAVLLHVVTLGLFSFVRLSMIHDRLPRVARDDPSASRAIGFSFIPYFNLYWIAFNIMRLTDRVNFQYRIRGRRERVSRNYMMFCAVLSVIPYVNFTLGAFAWIFGLVQMQRALNEIATMPSVEAEASTRVRADASATAATEPRLGEGDSATTAARASSL